MSAGTETVMPNHYPHDAARGVAVGPSTVTVVIPVYNGAEFVTAAIDSVLGQTWGDFAIVVVDDGSSDTTVEVVECHSRDPRISLIRHERNQGLPAARNTGIRAARGGYIAFLDADDCWLPNHLELAVGALTRHPELDVVLLESDMVEKSSGRSQGLWFRNHHKAFAELRTTDLGDGFHSIDSGLLYGLSVGCISHMQTLVGRHAFIAAHLFDETLRASEDLDWLIRAAHDRGMRAAFTHEVTSIYYRHDGSLTSVAARNSTRLADTEQRLFRRYLMWPDLDARERKLMRKRIAECCVDLAYYARKRGELRAAGSWLLQGLWMSGSRNQFREGAKLALSIFGFTGRTRSAPVD